MASAPAFVTGTTTTAFLSYLDIMKPEVWPQLIDRFGDMDMGLFEFWEMNGHYREVPRSQVEHYYTEHWQDVLRPEANVGAPGAGNPITFQLAAPENYDATGAYSFAQVQQEVMFMNGTIGTIVDKTIVGASNHTITVEPNDSAGVIPALTAGDSVVVLSNEYQEGSPDGPSTTNTQIWKRTFYTQIIREKWATTRSAAFQQAWFTIKPGDAMAKILNKGLNDNLYMFKGEKDTTKRFKIKKELGWLFGKRISNLGIAGALGYTPTSMEGLYPFVENNGGIVYTYVPGAFSIADWDTLNNRIDRAGGSKEYIWACGFQLLKDLENFVIATFPAGGVFFGNVNEKLAMKIGLQSFTKTGKTHHFMNYRLFNHTQFLGATGMTFPNQAIAMPTDVTGTDAEGNSKRAVDLYYLQHSRDTSWVTGNAPHLNIHTNTEDLFAVNHLTEIGGEWFSPERLVIVRP